MGKNKTVFNTRAIRYISCSELCSLVCMNRTNGVGRHTRVIPEALTLEAGSRHELPGWPAEAADLAPDDDLAQGESRSARYFRLKG